MSRLLARSLSTCTRLSNVVKAPVEVGGLDGVYAKALYSATYKLKAFDQVEKDLGTIQSVMEKDARFRQFLHDPTLQGSMKSKILIAMLDKMKASEATKKLFAVLVENGRLGLVESLISKFSEIMIAHRGEIRCVVKSAKGLDKGMEQEITTVLKAFLKPDDKLTVVYEIDPSILGGLVVNFPDKAIDLSLSTKMNLYRRELLAAL